MDKNIKYRFIYSFIFIIIIKNKAIHWRIEAEIIIRNMLRTLSIVITVIKILYQILK